MPGFSDTCNDTKVWDLLSERQISQSIGKLGLGEVQMVRLFLLIKVVIKLQIIVLCAALGLVFSFLVNVTCKYRIRSFIS
jgi:hypothetical protein